MPSGTIQIIDQRLKRNKVFIIFKHNMLLWSITVFILWSVHGSLYLVKTKPSPINRFQTECSGCKSLHTNQVARKAEAYLWFWWHKAPGSI